MITVKSILLPLLKFHQNMKHAALLPHQLLLLQKSRKLHWSFSCRLSLLMKSKAKHKFFYSVCQPSVILGSSFQQFQSFLRPWNLLENNFWKGRQTQNCFDVQRMSTRKVHLSLKFASHLYPRSSALHMSLEIRHQPPHLK